MSVGQLCNREVVVAASTTTAADAAALMRRHHVGDLVVLAPSEGVRRPVGVVTDRDLVQSKLIPYAAPVTDALREAAEQRLKKSWSLSVSPLA